MSKDTPIKHQIQYHSGYVAAVGHLSAYAKTGEKIAVVTIAVQKENGNTLETYASVATLPNGFRPSEIVIAGGGSSTGYVRYATVDPSGIIRVATDGNVLAAYATIVFIAA